MKKIVSVTEVDGEGLVGLLGSRVQLWCLNYIYEGDLVGVNDDCVRLDNAEVVYETGNLQTGSGRNAEKVKNALYVRLAVLESFTQA